MCRTCRAKYTRDHKKERAIYLENNKIRFSARASVWSRSLKGRHARVKYLLKKEGVSKFDPLWGINYYAEIIRSDECHYCLGSLNLTGTGLDAANNSDGHVGHNVVPCCWVCNKVKFDHFSYEEMMMLSPILRDIRKQKVFKEVF